MSSTSVSVPSNSIEEILEDKNMNSTAATDLPPEIWSIIFANLSLKDRNSVRLTCRCFYTACDTPHAPEKIVCHDNNTGALVQTWSRAGRKLRNLTLYGVHLIDDSILEIFKIHGPFIQSLTLRNCELAPGLLKQIIKYCISLRNISLICISTQKHLFDDFLALECNRDVREDVTDFTFSLKNEASLSNLKFIRFFTIFPNICKLKMKIQVDGNFNQFSTLSADITSDAIFSFSCIYDQLCRMSNQLEDLNLHLINNLGDHVHSSLQIYNLIAEIQMPRLKKLSLNWINLWDTSAEPILPFKNLTRFHCVFELEIWRSHSPSTFVQLLLNTVPGLHTLKIDFMKEIHSFRMQRDCFVALVKSQLRNLDLRVLGFQKHHMELLLDFGLSSLTDVTLVPNNVLKCLIVILDHINFSVFTTYFQAIEYVIVGETHESCLSNMIKFQTQLKSLSLCNCDVHPVDSATPRDHSYLREWLHHEKPSRTFDQLTHLDILEFVNLDLAAFLLSEFKFPKLKSLTMRPIIKIKPHNEVDPILNIISALCELEYLEIGSNWNLPISDVLVMCRALPKLRYFVVIDEGGEPLDDLECAEFFNNCPLLQFVVHKESDRLIKYVRDTISHNILNVSNSHHASMYKIPKEYRVYRY